MILIEDVEDTVYNDGENDVAVLSLQIAIASSLYSKKDD